MKCSLLLKAWVLLFIGTMLFNLGYCCILLMISFRTTSSNSPRHPSASGRRRQIHHVIPTSPDDVVEFTTSSQRLRTTSSNSPRHPSASGRRRRIHHIIPARSRPALLVKSAFLSIYSCRIQKTPLKLNAKNKFKGEVCINFKNALF